MLIEFFISVYLLFAVLFWTNRFTLLTCNIYIYTYIPITGSTSSVASNEKRRRNIAKLLHKQRFCQVLVHYLSEHIWSSDYKAWNIHAATRRPDETKLTGVKTAAIGSRTVHIVDFIQTFVITRWLLVYLSIDLFLFLFTLFIYLFITLHCT